MGVKSFLDLFIPQEMKTDLFGYGKAQQIIGIGALTSLIVLLNSPRSFLSGDILSGFIVILFCLIIIGGLYMLKLTGSRSKAANSIVFFIFILFAFLCLMNTETNCSILNNMIFVVLLGFMLAGKKSGLIWGGISLS